MKIAATSKKSNDQLEPTVFVIFGGAGDLTWRKLVPALFDLSQDRSLPAQFAVIAVDRIKLGDDALRCRLHDGINQFSRFGKAKSVAWNQFAQHIHYQQGDFKKLQTYTALGKQCAKLEKEWGTKAHRIFYMATPPSMFGEIPKFLGKAGLSRDREFTRIVIEKPIGYDLESARALNAVLAASFDESQIFRIDHYLGKETVQNILAFRFANPLFEPMWNRRYIDYVTITVAETVGVEHRGGYYDHAGALRDMVQNHLMQLLCLVAMEPMVSFQADEIRNKKVDVLHAARPISPRRGSAMRCARTIWFRQRCWKKAPGYREEKGVAPDSKTETFAALKLFLDNWRWQDVPFYLPRASVCRSRHRKFPSNFAPCRTGRFRPKPRSAGNRPVLFCPFSPTKASSWVFRPNIRGRKCNCVRWICVSVIATVSTRLRPMPTKHFCGT